MISNELFQFLTNLLEKNHSCFDYVTPFNLLLGVVVIANIFLGYLIYQDQQSNNIPKSDKILPYLIIIFFDAIMMYFISFLPNNTLPKNERFFKQVSEEVTTGKYPLEDVYILKNLFEQSIVDMKDGSYKYYLEPIEIFLIKNSIQRDKKTIQEARDYRMKLDNWIKNEELKKNNSIPQINAFSTTAKKVSAKKASKSKKSDKSNKSRGAKNKSNPSKSKSKMMNASTKKKTGGQSSKKP